MSKSKRQNKDKKVSDSGLFGDPDVAAPAWESHEGHSRREVVAAIVRTAWATAQEWSSAWKTGGQQLKEIVAALVEADKDAPLEAEVHQAAAKLHEALENMSARVSTLADLVQQLERLRNCQGNTERDKPIFSTLALGHIVSVLSSVMEDYKQETAVKKGACHPLPATRNVDTLNTAVTIYSHHTFIETHLFKLKLLLRETQQL